MLTACLREQICSDAIPSSFRARMGLNGGIEDEKESSDTHFYKKKMLKGGECHQNLNKRKVKCKREGAACLSSS